MVRSKKCRRFCPLLDLVSTSCCKGISQAFISVERVDLTLLILLILKPQAPPA